MLWRWSHKKSEEENTKESEERADTEARGRIGGLRDLPLNSATRSTYQMQQRNAADLTTWNNVDKAQKLPVGIRFVSVTDNPVTFQSGRGSTLPGRNSTITLQNTQGKTNAVVVAQTGRILVHKN